MADAVPTNPYTTIPKHSGPVSTCFDDDPKLFNYVIAQPRYAPGLWPQTKPYIDLRSHSEAADFCISDLFPNWVLPGKVLTRHLKWSGNVHRIPGLTHPTSLKFATFAAWGAHAKVTPNTRSGRSPEEQPDLLSYVGFLRFHSCGSLLGSLGLIPYLASASLT